MKLHYILIDEQVVDILTKELPKNKLEYLRSKLGLVYISSLIEREGWWKIHSSFYVSCTRLGLAFVSLSEGHKERMGLGGLDKNMTLEVLEDHKIQDRSEPIDWHSFRMR